MLAARDLVHGPFAVANADDVSAGFYATNYFGPGTSLTVSAEALIAAKTEGSELIESTPGEYDFFFSVTQGQQKIVDTAGRVSRELGGPTTRMAS